MAISLGVGIVLGVYIAVMGFVFWFCVIADPETSPTARLIAHTLPNEFMKLAGKLVGSKGVKVIEAIMERLLAIIYLTVIIGCFSLLWWYGYPKARASTHIPDYHLTLGYVVVVFALFTWRKTMTTSPGIISKETIQFYDHYPYDDLLYVEGRRDRKMGLPRLPRSKYDRLKHHQHVARFDHYCGWVAATIGEENYRFFLLFVFTQCALCIYGTKILSTFFWGEIQDRKLMEVTFFDRASGKEYAADKWIIFQYLFHRHLIEAGVLAIMAVMSIAIGAFFVYHFYITSRGMTTNEHYKWGEVKKWWNSEVKRYEEFIAQQKSNNPQKEASAGGRKSTKSGNDNTGSTSKPTVPDGDVTCTGGTSTTGTNGEAKNNTANGPDNTVEDPGPMPINIYNRGFVENWKEVLFPVSIRRKNAARQAAEKAKAT